MRHAERHARRLARDAAALGLGRLDESTLQAALSAIGHEAFGAGTGVVRLALRPDPEDPGRTVRVATTRNLGPEPRSWRVRRHAEPHPGVLRTPGAKWEGVAIHAAAREAAQREGFEESLLVDASGALIEGARTNVFLVMAEDDLVTPPVASGAVAGVAREIVLERIPHAREEMVPFEAIFRAKEVVLVNAVRGAVCLARLDGRAVGSGARSWTARLHAELLSDPLP